MPSTRCLEYIPDIHSCSQLMLENAQLKKRLHKIRSENADLKKDLEDMTEKRKIEKLMRDFVTTHNMGTQTDPVKGQHFSIRQHTPKDSQCQKETNAQTNKLVSMHNALMRRYENELKKSMQQMENTTELQLEVNSLQQKLKKSELRIQELESKSRYKWRSQGRRGSFDSTSDDEDKIAKLKKELSKVKKEKTHLASDYKRVKSELKGLDAGFFEEVEDLKYALQQSADLNQRYERSLRGVCAKFGIPFPHPENTLRTTRDR